MTTLNHRMPVIFIGHGSPLLTLGPNKYTQSWAELGRRLPIPRAILAISAHWYIAQTSVTLSNPPKTIHDFYGFPDEMYRIGYPAPGSPQLAEQVADLLKPNTVDHDHHWGLDHGSWSVLRHIYPQAQIPVVQVSLDRNKTPEQHYRLGQLLSSLRDDGVLIIASGNIVHNLRAYDWNNPLLEPPAWATDFENWNCEQLTAGDTSQLIDYLAQGEPAKLAAPTPDHYLPLLYLAGLREKNDEVSFPVTGFDGGSMSMLSVQLTHKAAT